MLVCRFCRYPLEAQTGCAVCNPIKPHLASLEDQDEERPALSSVGSEAVVALRAQLRRCRMRLDKQPLDDAAGKGLVAASNGLAKLLEATRKLQADGLAAVQAMSFMERAELFINWYASLPPPYRSRLRDQLGEHEATLSKPRELPEHVDSPDAN